jgi:dihydropyrimidine dehydrogenase (NAD+) subunit PreA
MQRKSNLQVEYCGLKLENPVLIASANVSAYAEMVERGFDKGFAGVAFKTIGINTKDVTNLSPRMAAFKYKNKIIGWQNWEQISDSPLEENLNAFSYLKKNWPNKIIIASIMGFSIAEWKELAIMSAQAGADIIELNMSCPHMMQEGAGMKVGQTFELIREVTKTVKNAVSIPVIAKLTPNISDICEPALYAKEGGVDGLVAINTVSGLIGIDTDTYKPKLNAWGLGAISGYSGPAIKPIGLAQVTNLAKHPELNLPISGVGGIENATDVLEYMLCGASNVQICTAIMTYGYGIIDDILNGLDQHLQEKELNSIGDIIGKALPNITSMDKIDEKRGAYVEFDTNRCKSCKKCYISCQDAGGQCIVWDEEKKIPIMGDKDKCHSCMICRDVCIVNPAVPYAKEHAW